ncbi:MAG: leucine--tRNA ligase [Candidatus Methylarchaceae archaeon HK01B]|nr:leucine--tRNA ligase [Candidatus Methylarchaceae archaeon HK01B]
MVIDWSRIREKWRRVWEESHIFEADVDLKKDKYFLTVAYPYPNSPQHIGHGRTYTLADVHARYMRMCGKNALLPMAFHYTGTPILAMSKRLAEGDKELIDTFTNIYKVPMNEIKEFKDPLRIARYFHEEIKEGMKEMGYSIDWRREFTTIDPQYSRFIEWQFKKLYEKGYVVQGSHPVGWCPKDGSPVGQHDTIGDVEPEIGEFIIIKFFLDGYILPAATLRPETVFGVTNIWLNPDVEYVKARVDGEDWIASKECLRKILYLNRKVEEIEGVRGAELIGKWAENPLTGLKVPILPASFVDPKNATGVVMSVPGHAPYDYQALKDLKKRSEKLALYNIDSEFLDSIVPISIIEIEGYSDLPALDVIEKMGIESQDDPKLEEATAEVYSREFHSGRMKANTIEYAGLLVSIAKERVKEDLIQSLKGDTFYEILNRPVICRCGTECIVKIFENQWFINYGDEFWKELAEECLENMKIVPDDLLFEFKYTIGWLKQKACARKSGLGTRLPWDKEWIIESLSDSVIYMAYYTISKYIKFHDISPDQLTDDFFDYVFLGKGDSRELEKITKIDGVLLKKIREEFIYFYPLDSRHSGRDLIPNHLTFFIFNHAAIFPKDLWPKQIVVNGSVLMEGKKMSKSFGNIIPLRQAIRIYGADTSRLAVLSTAELLQDADFSPILARSLNGRLERFYDFAMNVIGLKSGSENIEFSREERWLISKLQKTIRAATKAMDELRVREAINYVLYELDQDLQWYLKRSTMEDSSKNKKEAISNVLKILLNTKVRLLAPFTPYICEEIWEKMGKEGLASVADWPTYDEKKVDEEAEEMEEMIMKTLEDTSNIIKVTKIKPNRIFYYTSAEWKWEVYLKALEIFETGILEIGGLMKKLMEDTKMKKMGKELYRFVQRIYDEVLKIPPDLREKRLRIRIIDELSALRDATDFLEKEMGAKVEVYSEEDSKKFDPKDRAKLAQPYRVAIYILSKGEPQY